MIFLYLLAKLPLFKVIKLSCSAQSIENFFGRSSTRKKLAFLLLQFYKDAKARKKPSLKQIEQLELKVFQTCLLKLTSMLLKVLQNQEEMRLNIGKKLKTASLDSRFTKGRVYLDLLTFENF